MWAEDDAVTIFADVAKDTIADLALAIKMLPEKKGTEQSFRMLVGGRMLDLIQDSEKTLASQHISSGSNLWLWLEPSQVVEAIPVNVVVCTGQKIPMQVCKRDTNEFFFERVYWHTGFRVWSAWVKRNGFHLRRFDTSKDLVKRFIQDNDEIEIESFASVRAR